MNIALDGSTYTKTIDLKPQDFYKLPTFDDFGTGYNCSYSQPTPRTSVIQNGQVSHSLNESNEPSISPTTTSNNLIGLSFFSSWTKPRTSSRPTFFSRFARRLTIRRTYSKPPSAIPSSSNANSSMPQCQVPTGLKIRRWLSKHLIPPQKNSPCKPLPGNLFYHLTYVCDFMLTRFLFGLEAFSTRAATFDGAIDKRISQPTEDFGSVPIQRRGLPQPNLSESSLCNSQAGTLSLGDDPHEVNGIVLHQVRPTDFRRISNDLSFFLIVILNFQGSCSYEKERLISACACKFFLHVVCNLSVSSLIQHLVLRAASAFNGKG